MSSLCSIVFYFILILIKKLYKNIFVLIEGIVGNSMRKKPSIKTKSQIWCRVHNFMIQKVAARLKG